MKTEPSEQSSQRAREIIGNVENYDSLRAFTSLSGRIASELAEKDAEINRLGHALQNLLGDMYLVECDELTRKAMNIGSRQEALTVAAEWHDKYDTDRALPAYGESKE